MGKERKNGQRILFGERRRERMRMTVVGYGFGGGKKVKVRRTIYGRGHH